jgi:hypothetical protein
MITLRLGVEGSLTPWAQAPAGATNASMIKTNRFMRHLPSKNVREANTVPSRPLHGYLHPYRGTAISLPSLQTPWAALPAGRLPVTFRTAVGRDAAWVVCVFFTGVVTMLELVVLG